MAVLKQPYANSVTPDVIALTPLNLYLQRVQSVTDKLRADAAGLEYIPLQYGGLIGQQQSLLAASVVKIIDFKVISQE